MTSAPPPSARPLPLSRGAAFASRVVDGVGALGFGAFVWPPLIGVGLAAGTLMLKEPRFAAGMLKHRSTLEFTKPAFRGIVVYTVAALLVAIALALVGKRRGRVPSLSAGYLVALRRLAVLSTLPFVLAMREPLEPARDWLALASILTTAAVTTYSVSGFLGTRAPAAGPLTRFATPIVVLFSMIAFSLGMTKLAVEHHVALGTGRADVGAALSVLRETGQGRLLQCSLCLSGSPIPRHFEPIALLVAPLFRLRPTAETLFVLTALSLALGAPALFLLGRRATESAWAGAALAAAYLLHPGTHGAALSGYHSVALAAPLFLWMLWFLETEKTRRFLAMVVLSLLTREDVALAVVGVAVFALFSGSRERVRLGVFALCAVLAYGAVLAVLRQPSPPSTFIASLSLPSPLDPKGKIHPRGMAAAQGGPFWTLLVALSTTKMDYAAKTLAPLLGLPLLARGRILLGYGAALALLSSAPDLGTPSAAETSLLVPFLFGLAALALGRVRTEDFSPLFPAAVTRALPAGILVASTLCSMKFGALTENKSFRAGTRPLVRVASVEQHRAAEWLEDVIRKLPKGAKVAVSARLSPHVGRAGTLYALEDRGRADFVVFQGKLRAAKLLATEEGKGELVRYMTRGDLRVVRTRYRAPLPSNKPIDDE